VASLSSGPLTCSQMIFRAVMAALEKPSVEFHQDGTRPSVLLPARRRSSSPSTELPCLLATVGQLVQIFYLQRAIYEGRGPCRLDRWLVPHILGLVVGGQNDREPSYRLARN
jgi:hypothetical protein